MTSENDPQPPDSPSAGAPILGGLDPLGLLDAVMTGDSGDWEPPAPEVLEPWFHGFDEFRFLDRGGMGAVYAARQKSLDRPVAIKILPPELGHDADFVERFHQEARLLARMQHPHIVTIYDFGTTAADHLFIVMEYVPGTTVAELMKKERLSALQVVEIATQVCEALEFAHDHGVIHRDIKPTNILLDDRGRARVADFGLAKLTPNHAIAKKTSTRTRVGRALGTPGYAAPEQRRAEPEVDQRADIFSLGVTLYEMLTGHLPIGVFESPSRKVGSPPALDRVILRALQERPALRYQSVAQMRRSIIPIAVKLGAPGFRRQILQRPLTAGVIVIQLLVVSWLLWERLFEKPQEMVVPTETLNLGDSTPNLRLNEDYMVIMELLTWRQAEEMDRGHEEFRLAQIESAEEQEKIQKLLVTQGMRAPVWIGGFRTASDESFRWLDDSPVDYANWMPSHDTPPVIITEIQAKNSRTLRTSGGFTPDWIELYNPGSQPVDLTGWRLRHIVRNSGGEGRLRSLQGVSTIIEPGAYRLVYFGMLKGDSRELTMPFSLEAQGARLRWCDPRGEVIQDFRQDWPRQQADVSMGGDENGLDWGLCREPTPGAPNALRTSRIPEPRAEKIDEMCILMLPDFDGRWTQDIPQRKAWILVEQVR